MDLFKKFLGLEKADEDKSKKRNPPINDEFRKPAWVEEYDTDDELFDSNKILGVQIFTNPIEMQKHFERQMEAMLQTLEELDDDVHVFDRNLKEEYLKPGFEKEIDKEMIKKKKALDTDLDGEIYADQLHSLLQRIQPELKSLVPKKPETMTKEEMKKRSEGEKVMDKIHGIVEEDSTPARTPRRRSNQPRYHEGIFEGTFQGPRMFGQSIISQTIRKPDGSYETRRTVRDSEGNRKTTITRFKDGETDIVESYGAEQGKPMLNIPKLFGHLHISDNNEATGGGGTGAILDVDRKHYCLKDGYTLPKNLW